MRDDLKPGLIAPVSTAADGVFIAGACQCCVTCIGACPSGAAYQMNFRDEQIFAEVKGILAV